MGILNANQISFILALREVLVAKLVISGISPLTSFILALREALLAELVTSDFLFPTVLILASYTFFLTK